MSRARMFSPESFVAEGHKRQRHDSEVTARVSEDGRVLIMGKIIVKSALRDDLFERAACCCQGVPARLLEEVPFEVSFQVLCSRVFLPGFFKGELQAD